MPTIAPLVLIVDDYEDNREMYAAFLIFKGYRVETAVNGHDGFLKAVALRPDVVVMDLAMPALDGWETTRRLKSAPATGHIPVVCLSGFTSVEDRQRAVEAGCDVFLTKPLVPGELYETLVSLLDQRGDSLDRGTS